MNIASNGSLVVNNSLLNELYRDKTSLVSELPKDVVNLIESYLPSFTKISEETSCRRTIRIAFRVKDTESYPLAAKIVSLYNSTKTEINGVSTKIEIAMYHNLYVIDTYAPNYMNVNVVFFDPAQEFTDVRPCGCCTAPVFHTWMKMDLNEEQRKKLQKLSQRFSIVECGNNPEHFLLKVLEKVVGRYREYFPGTKLMGDCTIQ